MEHLTLNTMYKLLLILSTAFLLSSCTTTQVELLKNLVDNSAAVVKDEIKSKGKVTPKPTIASLEDDITTK